MKKLFIFLFILLFPFSTISAPTNIPDVLITDVNNPNWVDVRRFTDIEPGLTALANKTATLRITKDVTLDNTYGAGTYSGVTVHIMPGFTCTITNPATYGFNVIVEDKGVLAIDSSITIGGNLTIKGDPDTSIDKITGDEVLTVSGMYHAYFDITGFDTTNLDRITKYVFGVAELRLLEGTQDGDVRYLTYHTTMNDGGHGKVIWDADSTASDDGGVVFQVFGIATGRWIRQLNGFVTPEMFGANGTDIIDDSTEIQNAIDYVISSGIKFQAYTGQSYVFTTPLEITRDELNPASIYIDFNNALLDFTALTGSQIAVTFGSIDSGDLGSASENAQLIFQNAIIHGPDRGITTTTTGLRVQNAFNARLHNLIIYDFYNGCKLINTYPGRGTNCAFDKNAIGLWHDEASNYWQWDSVSLGACTYGLLIYPTTNAIDDYKINNLTFNSPRFENVQVGVTIDAGPDDDNSVTIRDIAINNPYCASAGGATSYDLYRLGTHFTYATPQTRGDGCRKRIYGISITGGIHNYTSLTATRAILVFGAYSGSSTSVRQFRGDFNGDFSTSYAIVGSPYGGELRYGGYPDITVLTQDDRFLKTIKWGQAGSIYETNQIYELTSSGVINPYGMTLLNADNAIVTGTLADGTRFGQRVTIKASNVDNAVTVSVTNHILGDPTVLTFTSVNHYVILEWDGLANWHPVYSLVAP